MTGDQIESPREGYRRIQEADATIYSPAWTLDRVGVRFVTYGQISPAEDITLRVLAMHHVAGDGTGLTRTVEILKPPHHPTEDNELAMIWAPDKDWVAINRLVVEHH